MLLALHNAEEAFGMGQALPLLLGQVPDVLRAILPDITFSSFLVALVVVTVAPVLILASMGHRQPSGWPAYALLAVQATILLNVLSHLMAAVKTGGYVPGLFTALLINFPFSMLLLGRAWRDRWYSGKAMVALVPLAFLLHGPLLLAILSLASQLIPRF
ncbi:HXXEE domain-containing protein [Microvirga sp. SYSU G3D207]|uniref:HXXEE domain-containing protein n=1 Tax=Microvirga arsenatis TaxID=2692265 RepID=A0ABW9Z4H9_9HYPH|nr:HXXEE domain-containing protein [Microvirga arsenatis]NBJ26846.1 HXXEE domain-containing protein [Microvirga arsenatis]